MNFKEILANGNVQAFLQVIRAGEGTLGDNGYRTLFGGSLFDSFASHPRRVITAGLGKNQYTSSAAGAYQILTRTWDGLVKQYGFQDFTPHTQDCAAVALIAGRKALQDIIDGNIEIAIKKCNKEWASLPGSPYGQPTKTLDKALETYRLAGGYMRPIGTLAPVEERSYTVDPITGAVLATIVQNVPSLIRIFGKGERSEKNAKAAELVVDTAVKAVGAVNAQDLKQKLDSGDPQVVETVKNAVQSIWYEISTDPAGVEKAREFDLKSAENGFWKQPAFWITILLLPLIYGTVGTVLGLVGSVIFSTEVQIMVVSTVVSGLLGAIAGYWLGTSWSSSRKTELLNK